MENKNPSIHGNSDLNGLPLHQSKKTKSYEKKFNFNEFLTKLSDTVSESCISKSQEQEICILRQEIKENHQTLQQYKLILSTIKDVANKTDAISPVVAQKVNKIIAVEQATQFLHNCPVDCYPLGLSDKFTSNQDYKILYAESVHLQLAVEDMLIKKCCSIKDSEKQLLKHTEDKTILLKLNHELEKAVMEYNESIIEAFDILREICDQYIIPLAKINTSTAECLVKELHAIEFKTKFLECKQNCKIYSEDKNILPSVEKIDTSLKLEIESVSLELKNLRNLKIKYDEISQTDDYQKVLKEYLEMKKSVQDKKWVLKQC